MNIPVARFIDSLPNEERCDNLAGLLLSVRKARQAGMVVEFQPLPLSRRGDVKTLCNSFVLISDWSRN